MALQYQGGEVGAKRLTRLISIQDNGQSVVEYTLAAALVAIPILLALGTLEKQLIAMFNRIEIFLSLYMNAI